MTLADLLEARGQAPEGVRVLMRVANEWPDSDYALRELSEALSRRGFQERAFELQQRILKWLPGENAIWQKLVDRHVRFEEYADAILLLETMQERQPMAMGYALQIADLYRRSEEPDAAVRVLKQVIASDPDSPTAYQRLANLEDERNNKPSTLDAFKLALARDPKNTSLRERVDLLEPQGQEFAEKFVPSEDDIDAAVNGAANTKIEPGAHVVLLLDQEVTDVARDGSSKRYVSIVAKALDDQGRDALTQMGIPGGNTKLQRAYSVNKRGERQEVSSVQGDSIRFRQLEVGSIVVLQYTWYAPPQTFLPNHFAYAWRFESVHRQHEKSKWTLITAEGVPLSVQVNGNVKQMQTKVDGHDVRVFSAEHVPALIYEPFMPPQDEVLASVDVSTVRGWDEYVRWERALLVEAFRSSPEIEALAKRLTENAKTPQEKLDRILHFAAREIRYQQEYETTIAGVRPHACPVVLERGYGDCKDKSVLIIKLAKLVGITVEFAILRTTNVGAVKKAIPNQQFNHAIVYVPKQPGFAEGFFMDATTEGLDIGNLRSDDQGATSLVLDAEGEGYRFLDIPYQAANLDYEDHALVIKVASESAAEATDSMTLRGTNASQLRVMLRNEQVAKKAIEGIGAYLFPGSSLKESKPKNHDDIIAPLELKLTLDVSTSLTREGTRTRMKIPAQLSLLRTATLATRKTEIVLGVPNTVTYRYDIALPDGYRVAHLPEAFTITHACFTAKRTSEAKDRSVKLTLELQRTCTRIKVADYPVYRETLQKLTNLTQQELVFERKQMAAK
jgi:tetratricopeptide (TPR) repeat protein